MSNQEDTPERLIAEMTGIIRRAIALGRKLGEDAAVERIVRAVKIEAPNELAGAAPELRLVPPTRQRKYPYGLVKQTVTRALKQASGLEKERIGPYCKEQYGVDIDDKAIANTLKQMGRDQLAVRKGGKFFLMEPDAPKEEPGRGAPRSSSPVSLSVVGAKASRKVGGT